MNYKNKSTMLMLGTALALFATLFNACKKYDNPAPFFEEYGRAKDSFGERKVLIISIDGAIGQAVKSINPVNIAGMLKNSKYNFNGASDVRTNSGSTWASMMSGVNSAKHRVLDDQFNLEANASDDHEEIVTYPSSIARMLDVRPEFKTVAATSSSALSKYLVHTDHNILTKNDQEVKDSIVKVLETENPRVVIADLREVATAGTTFGFSADVPEYKDAIVKADAYIGEILAALKKRKNYSNEDWLVMVSSSHGGLDKSYGGSTQQERNIFSIFYNPNFKELEMKATPYYSVRYWGNGESAAELAAGRVVKATANDPTGMYNPGNGSMTISAKILINRKADGTYSYSVPPFLSKVSSRSGTNAGWSFFRNGNGVSFFVANDDAKAEITGANVGIDGKWHTITGTINKVGAEYKTAFYVDGIKVAEGTLAATKLVTSTAPLVLGYHPSVFLGGFIDMYQSDVKIWNKALSPEAIKANVAQTEVPTTDPDYANLISYWPGTEGKGSVLTNKIAGRPNFNISGKYSWELLGSNPATGYEPADPNMVVIQNVDITSQMYYWLRVPVKDAWGLDGKVWLNKYEIEFIKQ